LIIWIQIAAWRFITNYFYPNAMEGDYLIKGIQFQWDDGIFSVALGHRNKPTGYRTAYFHAASSYSEYNVSTEILQNESNVRLPYQGNNFKLFGQRPKGSNVGIHVHHLKTGVVFNAELQQYRITCNNLAKPFISENIGTVFHDETNLIYPADLSVGREVFFR
jgi:dopachrome tautomerase